MREASRSEPRAAPLYYPLCVDIRGRRCVVVGGGRVAARKVELLLESGAAVTVISPTLVPELQRLADQGVIEAIVRPYCSGDLDGAFLVVAATDSKRTNRAVALDAQRKNLLVNVVDDPGRCNFIVPAVVRRGDLVIAISTGGQSPALARWLRTELERVIGSEYADLLALIADVRNELKQRGLQVRANAWQAALEGAVLDLVRRGMIERAREALLEALGTKGDSRG